MFSVTIVNPKRVLFEEKAQKVFLKGDTGEFEILNYHARILSLLQPGNIVIDGKKAVKIKGGIACFDKNALVVLVES